MFCCLGLVQGPRLRHGPKVEHACEGLLHHHVAPPVSHAEPARCAFLLGRHRDGNKVRPKHQTVCPWPCASCCLAWMGRPSNQATGRHRRKASMTDTTVLAEMGEGLWRRHSIESALHNLVERLAQSCRSSQGRGHRCHRGRSARPDGVSIVEGELRHLRLRE